MDLVCSLVKVKLRGTDKTMQSPLVCERTENNCLLLVACFKGCYLIRFPVSLHCFGLFAGVGISASTWDLMGRSGRVSGKGAA